MLIACDKTYLPLTQKSTFGKDNKDLSIKRNVIERSYTEEELEVLLFV
jgi:hypothetical protein